MDPDKATEVERMEDRAAEREEDSEDQAHTDAVGDHHTILECNRRTAILGKCHWGEEESSEGIENMIYFSTNHDYLLRSNIKEERARSEIYYSLEVLILNTRR